MLEQVRLPKPATRWLPSMVVVRSANCGLGFCLRQGFRLHQGYGGQVGEAARGEILP